MFISLLHECKMVDVSTKHKDDEIDLSGSIIKQWTTSWIYKSIKVIEDLTTNNQMFMKDSTNGNGTFIEDFTVFSDVYEHIFGCSNGCIILIIMRRVLTMNMMKLKKQDTTSRKK